MCSLCKSLVFSPLWIGIPLYIGILLILLVMGAAFIASLQGSPFRNRPRIRR